MNGNGQHWRRTVGRQKAEVKSGVSQNYDYGDDDYNNKYNKALQPAKSNTRCGRPCTLNC